MSSGTRGGFLWREPRSCSPTLSTLIEEWAFPWAPWSPVGTRRYAFFFFNVQCLDGCVFLSLDLRQIELTCWGGNSCASFLTWWERRNWLAGSWIVLRGQWGRQSEGQAFLCRIRLYICLRCVGHRVSKNKACSWEGMVASWWNTSLLYLNLSFLWIEKWKLKIQNSDFFLPNDWCTTWPCCELKFEIWKFKILLAQW